MLIRPKIVLVHPDARHPTYATEYSSGMDLYSCEEVFIRGGRREVVNVGIVIELPPGFEGQVRSRSGLAAKQGVFVLNSPGTIDQDYRGEVKVILQNASEWMYQVTVGERIAQLVIAPVIQFELEEITIKELTNTARGDGGFGSTGV